MTNDVFCVGLTWTELQTLTVLLPETFSIMAVHPPALDTDMIERVTNQARCIVLNPKRLSVEQLGNFFYDQDYLRLYHHPIPIILFSDEMTHEQKRLTPMPDFSILVIDLYKRLDHDREFAIKLLQTASRPSWQSRKIMHSHMFNDAWYLLGFESTGLDIWKDRITAIRVSKMTDFEVDGETTIYIRQPDSLPEHTLKLPGITDDRMENAVSLEKAIEELDSLLCESIPLIFTEETFTEENFTTEFLHAAFLCCGKTFDRPYIAIDKLATIPFGYLMESNPPCISVRDYPILPANLLMSKEMQALYALTSSTFDALVTRYNVHCPGQFDNLYATPLHDV